MRAGFGVRITTATLIATVDDNDNCNGDENYEAENGDDDKIDEGNDKTDDGNDDDDNGGR